MNPSQIVAIAVTALLAVSVYTDLRSRTIPDSVSVAMLVLALLATWRGWHAVSFAQLGIGLSIGFAIGAALFYGGAMGGGDAKLCAALGAVVGSAGLFEVLFATALFGGLVAYDAQRRGSDTLPYAPAFAAGYVTTVAITWWLPPHGGLWHLITGRPM